MLIFDTNAKKEIITKYIYIYIYIFIPWIFSLCIYLISTNKGLLYSEGKKTKIRNYISFVAVLLMIICEHQSYIEPRMWDSAAVRISPSIIPVQHKDKSDLKHTKFVQLYYFRYCIGRWSAVVYRITDMRFGYCSNQSECYFSTT